MPIARGQSERAGLLLCSVVCLDGIMWLNLSVLPSALETEVIGRRVIYMTSTESTMDVARHEANAGAAEGTLVIAEEQSAGRGRFGRSWVSPAGKNLYVTLILRPAAASAMRRLSIVAPLAVCKSLEDEAGLAPRIKWPNDVLLSGRKVAGVLIENELSGASPRYSLVGIGINVNFDIPKDAEIAEIATSIKAELGHEVSRIEVLAALLNHFEGLLLEAASGEAVLLAWKDHLETLGRRVTITFREQSYEGLAEDVDEHGNLLLRRDDGSLLTVEAGEVTLRSTDPGS